MRPQFLNPMCRLAIKPIFPVAVMGVLPFILGCSLHSAPSESPDSSRVESGSTDWHLGEWVLDKTETQRANKGLPGFESRWEEAQGMGMRLETSRREVMLAEQLSENRWDTTRMVVLGVNRLRDKAVFRIYEGPPFVLYRSDAGVYFVEPNGIKVCFRP